ncbi:MAG: tetratricopeptide repeat protein, partial [Candidatus Rokuibacteriota bacterium]
LWAILVAMGEPGAAVLHIEEGQRLYDPERPASQALGYAHHDAFPCAWDHLATACWVLGYPDRALAALRESRRHAERRDHPMIRTYGTLPTAISLSYRMWVHYNRGDLMDARGCANELVELGTNHEFSAWVDDGAVLLACIAAADAHPSVRELYERVRSRRPGRAAWRTDHCLCMLAGATAEDGTVDLGLEILAAIPEERRDVFFAPEIERIRGELLVRRGERDDAERCFRTAIEIARRRDERSLELRAATSLARLLAQSGRRLDAGRLLGEIYEWFTEGFDTADLRQALALLDELKGAPGASPIPRGRTGQTARSRWRRPPRPP